MPCHRIWYCCACNFGPNNFDIDLNCPSCYTRRCHGCTLEMASHSYHAGTSPYPGVPQLLILTNAGHTHCGETSNRPSGGTLSSSPSSFCGRPPVPSSAGDPDMHQASIADSHDLLQHGGIMNQRPSGAGYYCCQCKDGPKLWEVQPVCVNCSHYVCPSCTPAW
jgi:hypothetical protein